MSEATGLDRLAVLAHEVRSPVAALTAIDRGLASSTRGELDRREAVTLVRKACRAIERIVLDASFASVRREPVAVAVLLREASSAAELGGARVRLEVPDTTLVVEADPVRIRQALDNLLSNAIAHSSADAEIVLAASTAEDGVLLSVTDGGPGVPAGDRELIFEPGERLGATYAGTGLGLFVSRAIAEAHGGRLTVESPPGAGATFTLVLPHEGATTTSPAGSVED